MIHFFKPLQPNSRHMNWMSKNAQMNSLEWSSSQKCGYNKHYYKKYMKSGSQFFWWYTFLDAFSSMLQPVNELGGSGNNDGFSEEA